MLSFPAGLKKAFNFQRSREMAEMMTSQEGPASWDVMLASQICGPQELKEPPPFWGLPFLYLIDVSDICYPLTQNYYLRKIILK